MRKFIVAAVAAASLVVAASAANAGFYVPTCWWVYTIYGPIYTCG